MYGFGKSRMPRDYRRNPRLFNHPALILPSVTGWFEADDLAPLGAGAAVASFPNRVSGANALAQASSANRPTYNVYDGYPGIHYNANSQWLSGQIQFSTRATVFIVAHYMAANTDWNGFLYLYGSSYCMNINMRYQSFLGVQGCNSNQYGFSTNYSMVNTWRVYTWEMQQSTIVPLRFRVNGVDYVSNMSWFNGDSTPQMGLMTLYLGSNAYAGTARVRSLIVCASTVPSDLIALTERYYMARYGLS